jgi:hypothetical protein
MVSSGKSSESVVSPGWDFNDMRLELDRDDLSDDDESELILDSGSEEWDEECLNLASEGDLEVNRCLGNHRHS